MKVYRIELLIVDHDGIGADEIEVVLENQRYPNRCINPHVMAIESKEVEWTDDHPLNKTSTCDETFRALFPATVTPIRRAK